MLLQVFEDGSWLRLDPTEAEVEAAAEAKAKQDEEDIILYGMILPF